MKDQAPTLKLQGSPKVQRSRHVGTCSPVGTLNLGASFILGVWSLILSCPVMSQTPEWSQLPPLPDREGFAAMFAGVSGDALVVAGGANFPEKRPWEGGTKVWYDDVWVLEKPEAAWRKAGKLPRPLGYGVTVTWKDEVLCVGGSNADGHHAEVFSLRLDNGAVKIKDYRLYQNRARMPVGHWPAISCSSQAASTSRMRCGPCTRSGRWILPMQSRNGASCPRGRAGSACSVLLRRAGVHSILSVARPFTLVQMANPNANGSRMRFAIAKTPAGKGCLMHPAWPSPPSPQPP